MPFVMGRNCLSELLKHHPERIEKVYFQDKERQDSLLQEVISKNISLEITSKNKLFLLVNSDSHQGFVVKIKERQFLDLNPFLKQDKEISLVVALDTIFDPQNFGAILRCSECFNVDAVLWSKNRGAEISPVAAKAASGAFELVPLIRVSNLVDALSKFQDNDYEVVVSDVNEKAKQLPTFTFPKKCLLVIGSEGEGVRPLIRKKADHLIYIPMKGKISSLNVSQATAIFLFNWRFHTFYTERDSKIGFSAEPKPRD